MARREWQSPPIHEREGAAGREWYFRYRVKVLEYKDGKPVISRVEKWRSLGLCSKVTKRQAEREKDKILQAVNNQVYTIQSQVPFTQVVKEWLDKHVSGLSGPTQVTYQQQIRRYIEPALGELRLCDIDTAQVEQVFRSMESAGLSRATRATAKGLLKSIFGCARRWKYTDAPSPVREASIGGGPRRVRECRIPAVEDVLRLMDACEGDVPLLIETLVTTGMRISEAAGLDVSDLDFDLGRISVARRYCRGNAGQTKTEAGTRVLGMGSLVAALRAHVAGKKSTDPVFTYSGERIIDNFLLANHVSPAMVKLGIKFPGFGWHTFRRMHLSLMNQRGMSAMELRQQAGHADVRTTQRYIADDIARRAETVAAKPFLVRSARRTA